MSIDWFMLLVILKFLPEFLQCGPQSAVTCFPVFIKKIGGPVGKTPCFQCSRCGFDPWSGN